MTQRIHELLNAYQAIVRVSIDCFKNTEKTTHLYRPRINDILPYSCINWGVPLLSHNVECLLNDLQSDTIPYNKNQSHLAKPTN